MELTRAQETQLRRTGREAMEKVMAAAQQATQNGIQRATAKVTAVNGDCTADVNFGTDDYPMPLTGLRYTTGCCSMQVGDRVLVDTVSNQPLITGILANADNGPYVKLYSGTIVLKVNGGDSVLVWNNSRFKAAFGVDISRAGKYWVGFMNGDSSNSTHVEGCTVVDNAFIYAVFGSTTFSAIRLNYLVAVFA